MNNLIKCVTSLMIMLNLTACSYSPDALKNIYRDYESELAGELSEPMDLTVSQQKMVNDYTKSMMQWHRRNKLPEYAQKLNRLEHVLNSNKIAVSELQAYVDFFDDIPHFEQASYLTPKMAALGQSLTDQQVLQLEKYLKLELQQESLEASKSTISKEYSDGFIDIIKLLGMRLDSQQKQIISSNSKNLHDLRFKEIKVDSLWNQRLIAILKNRKNSNFITEFSNHWNSQDDHLIGPNSKLVLHNKRIVAVMVKELYLSLDQSQKNKVSQLLLSVSHTFSELANE